MSENRIKNELSYKKFTPNDLPKIRQMVKQIKLGVVSQQKAADRYGVTRHEVRKWLKRLENYDYGTDSDIARKKEIVQQILGGKMSQRQAALKYGLSLEVINKWVLGNVVFTGKRTSLKLRSSDEIKEDVKVQVVSKIQEGKLSQFTAATELRVTRYSVRKWISDYSMFNLDGKICYRMTEKMTPEQKEKELLEQIAKLKKELENKDLKIDGLETMIQVAEEKFGIKIKKKPGSNR